MSDEANALSSKDGSHSKRISIKPSLTTTQSFWKARTADAFLAAGGAAGSLAMLQFIQDNLVVETPIIKGLLVGSAQKFFFNRNPPDLEAFWKTTAASIVIGSSVHLFLWTNGSDKNGEVTILPNEYNNYLMLFLFMLFWKLEPGTIWGAGKSLGSYIAFESGFWSRDVASIGQFQSFVDSFPLWFILRPYLLGHAYLYICALGLAKVRQRVRIHILREELSLKLNRSDLEDNNSNLKKLQTDRQKLRYWFDRIDTDHTGRLSAMEFKIALSASLGHDILLEDCQQMIKSGDSDGDGTLDFNEFCEMVGDIIHH